MKNYSLFCAAFMLIVIAGGCLSGQSGLSSDANDPPSVSVTKITETKKGYVAIDSILRDDDSDQCSITVYYSDDGGETFYIATQGPGGDGVSNLATSPEGKTYTFIWDSLTDIGTTSQDNIIIKVVPDDGEDSGTESDSGTFTIDNTGNIPPLAAVISPSGIQDGHISIIYLLIDVESDSCSITVEYSVDGNTFFPATEGVGGDGTTGLSSSGPGIEHTFVWNSMDDVQTVDINVIIRIIPNDGTDTGTVDETDDFEVDNSANTPPSVTATTPSGAQTGEIAISYTLADADSDICNITVLYSLNGVDYYTTTEGTGGDSTSGLSSSPAGTAHSFVWDSAADFQTIEADVTVKIIPDDGSGSGTVDSTDAFTVDNVLNSIPAVTITSPSGGTHGGDITVTYNLSDADIQLCNIIVEYTLNGVDYLPATSGPGGDGTVALAATSAGVIHLFEWDSVADIGLTIENNVVIRITPNDGIDVGTADTSSQFTVDNFVNSVPEVLTISLSGSVPLSRDITVTYTLRDNDDHPCTITVQYSLNGAGGPFVAATEGTGGDGTTGLSSSGAGVVHTFAWDSYANFQTDEANVVIKITANDGTANGPEGVSAISMVENANNIPVANIADPSDPEMTEIPIGYTLLDNESDTCSITVEYSLNGVIWYPATEGIGGDGTTGLSSSPAGTALTFVWDSYADFQTNEITVSIRITVNDGYDIGGPFSPLGGTFAVENTPDDCAVTVIDPGGSQSGDSAITYSLQDPISNNLNITVSYSEDGGTTFYNAAQGIGGDGTTLLASSPVGTIYIYVWDSVADLGNTNQNDIQIRIVPTDTINGKTGTSDTTANFTVDNRLDTIVGTIDLSVADPFAEPMGIAVTPDSAYVYVANYGADGTGNTVFKIDASTDTVVSTITLSGVGPWDITIAPAGDYAYVSCYSDKIERINVSTNAVDTLVTLVDCEPQDLAISPDGATLYVACKQYNNIGIKVVDAATGTVTDTLLVPDQDLYGNVNGLAITPDGSNVFATDESGNHIFKMQTSDNSWDNILDLGNEMYDIVLHPDGSTVYATDYFGLVHVIDTTTNTETTTVADATYDQSWRLHITPDGSQVIVVFPGNGHPTDIDDLDEPLPNNGGYIFVVDTVTNTVVSSFDSRNPRGVKVAPNGKRAYVTDVIDNIVEIISF